MDQEAAGWSAEEVKQLIQTLGDKLIEQFVREHPYLQQRALAGFSRRLPGDYPQRLARFLIQRAGLNQQALKELITRWRQHYAVLCDGLQALEPPLTLESLSPLLQQHGGTLTLYALRTDPRAAVLSDIITTIRQGLTQGEISPTPIKAAPAETAQEPAKPADPNPQENPAPARAKERAVSHSGSLVGRPSGGFANRNTQISAPTTIPEFFAALEAEIQTLQATDQTLSACASQLAQPQTAHDPQALQRLIDRLTTTRQKIVDGLARFAALESDLLAKLRAEIGQAERFGLAENLSALLPPDQAPATVDEARTRILTLQTAYERLRAAVALNQQRQARLKAAPAQIQLLLDEIAGVGGDPAPFVAGLEKLKATPLESSNSRQIERALESAEQLQTKALARRNGLLRGWQEQLERACDDGESLLNQSLSLSADLLEITNLQAALERAHALMATPLAPNPPLPLPFPPGQISACYQTLRRQCERLRLAISNYNPQTALATLQKFENERPIDLTPQQVQAIGAALVGTASLREGYAGFTWRAGTTLLMLLESSLAEQFYERFGFAAVGSAIVASLCAGDFPLGLTFAEKEYLFYTGADVASVFRHPRVQDILSDACASQTFPPAAPDCFKESSPAVRQAALAFLRIAPQINLPEPLRLQLSAALLAAVQVQEERMQAGRLFIRTLIDQGQSLNAYCAWRALALEQSSLHTDPIGLDALYSLIWRLTLDSHTPGTQLALLCSDANLKEVSAYTPGIALALALGSLSLAHTCHPCGEELAIHFLDTLRDHHHYPALSDALLAHLPGQQNRAGEGAAAVQARQITIQATLLQLAEHLAEADHLLQVSNYRFAPTKQMRNQIDARLKPLLAALQQGTQPTGELATALATTEPAALANLLINDEGRIRRKEGRDPIDGNDLSKLHRNLESLLDHLRAAAAKHTELISLGLEPSAIAVALSNGAHPTPETQPEGTHSAGFQPGRYPWEEQEPLQAELRRLLSDVPQARDLLRRALSDRALNLTETGAAS
jgi:hypothetical protein